MKTLSFATLSFLSTIALSATVQAGNFSNASCETNINGEMSFANNVLLVKSDKQEDIVFSSNGDVSVNGKPVSLNNQQQQAAQHYFNNVEASIPIVVDITVEALSITNMALTEVFTGLLGENSEFPKVVSNKLSQVSKAIEDHVYQDQHSLTFNSAYMSEELGIDNGFEQEIEEIQEELMASFMGEMFMSLGKAMISGDSSFADLEKRMETLGDEIDTKANNLGKQLEQKAIDLCKKFEAIDQAENELQNVQELRHLDLVNVSIQKA